ncbi:hypothetical protein [Maribacter sp. IgM3_T14_3]|uniref:hypothetical protein n=1 Tax=Maribacter sp. IgM3_T14_3 TaxID=3415140 RepID=UPI003C6EB585
MSDQQEFIHITCNIDKNDPNSNQLIYCSQLYGTFFAVSGRLNIEDGMLNSITLYLLNYKGLYNIGMLKETKTSFKPEGNGVTLTLHLKANSGRHGKDRPLKVKCNNISIEGLKGLTVNRELHRMSRVNNNEHLQEGLFDSEFYQRDGSKIKDMDRLDDEKDLTRQDRCQTTYSKFV